MGIPQSAPPDSFNLICVAPARPFERVHRAKVAKRDSAELSQSAINECTPNKTLSEKANGFFHKVCVAVTVHFGVHFSQAFIVNAGEVPSKDYLMHTEEDDPCPCILCGNSNANDARHDPEKVAETLRFLLNALDKKIHGSGGRNFTKKSLPVHQVDGELIFLPCLCVHVCSLRSICVFMLQFHSKPMAAPVACRCS